MFKKTIIAVAAAALVASGGVAESQGGVGHPRAGREMAEKSCSPCHVVSHDQKQPPALNPAAPSFAQIAEGPRAADAWTLQTFLKSTHNSVTHPENMPNPQLSEEEIKTVTAYILSLRPKRR